jgi:DNA-binding NtrC family response regulator
MDKKDMNSGKTVLLVMEEGLELKLSPELQEIPEMIILHPTNREELTQSLKTQEKVSLIVIGMSTLLENNTRILSWIREEKPTIPLIMLTCYMSYETLQLATKMGCQEVIQLPVDHELIRLMIQKYHQ